MRILLVEDDQAISKALASSLRQLGHEVIIALKGTEALSQVADAAPEAIVLDLGLPDIDGFDLLKMVRAVSKVPVLAATARDDETVIVRTLNAGADDYMVKPFSAAQLDARLRAVMRRASQPNEEPLIVGGLHLDLRGREGALDGIQLDLSRKEFDLLAYLAGRPNAVVSKRELAAEIWGSVYGGSDKTVDVHLSWLRRKLGETASSPRYLRAVRGVGIKLVPPVP